MSESSNIELLPIHNRKSQSHSAIPSRPHTPSLQPSNPRSASPYSNVPPAATLPILDRPQFMLLVLLYLLQGIPVGLAFGSVPFLLKAKLSYSQVATFSLASYPYSLKLLWSPVVDAIYNKRLGRRKSWIIPIQLVSGFTLIYLGSNIDQLLEDPEKNLITITWAFFFLVFLCATQDIAVDGWALTILSPNALSYASTAQTIGLNTGYFLSFTIFLAFNSSEFSNKYLRSTPQDTGVLSLNTYLTFCGYLYLIVTVLVTFLVHEEPHHLRKNKRSDSIVDTANKSKNTLDSLKHVYASMFQVLRLPNIQAFIIILLISKIGFQANEGATNLKLLEKGFAREDLAITVLIDFPFEIIFGYYAAKWSTNDSGYLTPWLHAYLGRLVAAGCAFFVVMFFPSQGVTTSYFILVILQHLLGSFMSTIQFVSLNAFHTQIADPLIGGTYMTTLNTISNLGGQWPRYIVLNMIDWLTIGSCSTETNDFEPFKVKDETDKIKCKDAGGTYQIVEDGYYMTNFLCIVVGCLLFFFWISPKVKHLQSLSTSAWRVKN
ncbi:Acetyl-coenzyme A transporter 1 [Cyberlindnera fabianii]|uniref:Acetyl-coenzyme A transporter 1 n=1 Tax=Cyberlindnera fabianii TaxID=36022 RepID=A0A1V2L442_CYBFA|nr:Acetyl-coenzyme A transporter 1 [Cyberlindnera fabianii]